MKKSTDKDLAITEEYRQFITDMKARITAARLSAARSVNREMILLYWDIGKAIADKQEKLGWGESVVEMVASDLKAAFPGSTGFSSQNLWRMLQFYKTHTEKRFLSQVVRELTKKGTIEQTAEKLSQVVREMVAAVTWGGKDGYEDEARKFKTTRYSAGMPRTNDGALLFLQTMLAKMKPQNHGGSRIAIIFNGSPLSNGDCGSGESEIRRWILENDWLDAIVMLPDQLFYNTGIFTYIWLLTNNKPASHKGKVMLIDARQQFDKEPKSFGNKRNRILDNHRQWIEERYRNGWKDGYKDESVKIFNTKDFAYHKVSVVFWQTDENDKPAYITEPYTKSFTPANIKKEQEFYGSDLKFHIKLKVGVPLTLTLSHQGRGDSIVSPPLTGGDEGEGGITCNSEKKIEFTLSPKDDFSSLFEKGVKEAFADEIKSLIKDKTAGDKNKAIKTFINSLNAEAEFTHRHYVSDYEYIQYGEDIEEFLKREIGKQIIRYQDSTQFGYEILPNKYFYKYQPPKAADEVLKEFWRLEKDAEEVLLSLGGNERAKD